MKFPATAQRLLASLFMLVTPGIAAAGVVYNWHTTAAHDGYQVLAGRMEFEDGAWQSGALDFHLDPFGPLMPVAGSGLIGFTFHVDYRAPGTDFRLSPRPCNSTPYGCDPGMPKSTPVFTPQDSYLAMNLVFGPQLAGAMMLVREAWGIQFSGSGGGQLAFGADAGSCRGAWVCLSQGMWLLDERTIPKRAKPDAGLPPVGAVSAPPSLLLAMLGIGAACVRRRRAD